MKKYILLLPFLTLSLLIPLVSAHTITVPTNVYFGIPIYGTYINFNTQQTFDIIKRENSYWYFVTPSGQTYKFQVQNGNMTITDLFVSDSNKLTFTVTGDSGVTSTSKVYVSNKDKPKEVYVDNVRKLEEDGDWSWEEGLRTLTISITHSSSSNIEVSWAFGSAKGLYKLDVYVLLGGLPASAVVQVNGENKSTDFLGRASFQVPYGDYIVFAYLDSQVKSMSVHMNQDKDVGFGFSSPLSGGGGGSSLLAMPLLIIAGIIVFLVVFRKKRFP